MSGPAHILVVDDDADIRETLALLLQSVGYLVVEAANGRLALKALASATTFGLIILDLMMPVMDGFTFLASKARSAHAAIPVVIFSASPSMALEGSAGVIAVVPKLEGIDGLLAAIRSAEATAPLPYTPAGGSHV
jgi:CheY-like chemotaxis protein